MVGMLVLPSHPQPGSSASHQALWGSRPGCRVGGMLLQSPTALPARGTRAPQPSHQMEGGCDGRDAGAAIPPAHAHRGPRRSGRDARTTIVKPQRPHCSAGLRRDGGAAVSAAHSSVRPLPLGHHQASQPGFPYMSRRTFPFPGRAGGKIRNPKSKIRNRRVDGIPNSSFLIPHS